MPALRERQEDIYLLFRKFASDVANKYRMTEGISLTEDARQLLLAYQWPGNVRQLLHIVEEMSIIESERTIDATTLQRYLPQFVSGVSVGGGASANSTTFDPGEKQRLYMILAELHRQMEEVRERLGLHDTPKQTPRSLPAGSAFVSPASDGASKSSPSKIEDVGEVEEVGEFEAHPNQNDYVSLRNPDSSFKKMADVEREAIEKTVKRNNGNKRQAAKDLDISERTIHRKISDMDIE